MVTHPSMEVCSSHTPTEIDSIQEIKRKPLQDRKCPKRRLSDWQMISFLCPWHTSEEAGLAPCVQKCPCVHPPILPARSASGGQLPTCLAPEAFFFIPLGVWTWWAGLFCHFGIRHHHCSSGSESIVVKLPSGLGKKNEIREKGQLSPRGKWRKVQKIARNC